MEVTRMSPKRMKIGNRWVFMSDNEAENREILRKYSDSNSPPSSGEPASAKSVPEGNPPAGTPLAGRYQSPSYLSAVPAGSSPVKTAPRAGSPTKTCALCHGSIQDGQCTKCNAKQCPSCGEMNFSLSTTCLRCGKDLKK